MSFQLAYPDSVAVPRYVDLPIAADEEWEKGALVVADTDHALAECSADPSTVAAVADAPTGADSSGFNQLGVKEFPPGRMQAIAIRNQFFTAEYVGTLPAADGGSYGVVRDIDGKWKVDFDETSAVVVKLVDRRTNSPENVGRVVVRFLDAVIQDV